MTCQGGKPRYCNWRYGIAYIGFLGNTLMYGMRLNLSLAIVCMVKRAANQNSTTATNETFPFLNDTIDVNGTTTTGLDGACVNQAGNDTRFEVEGTFEWSRSLQGAILSAYFYGYIVTQIPGGWLANRIGPRLVLAVGLGLSGLCTLLTPLAARTNVYFVLVLRVICGLGSGVNFPAYHTLWSRWAPVYERTKLVSVCYSGSITGNIVTYFISGYLCVYGFDGGWPSIFYIIGIFQIVWLVLFLILVYDSPTTHPFIEQEERDYIIKEIGSVAEHEKNQNIPWLTFFKSPPLMAILVAHICNNYCQYTIIICLPTYMRDVLKFDMKQNGLYSSLPYVIMFVSTIIFGWVADNLRERGFRTVIVRKVYQSLGSILPGAFLVAASFVSCETRMTAVGLLVASVGFSSFNRSGYVVNHLDIAPRFAGILMGLTNTFATVPGMIAPVIVGQLTTNGTREEWQIVFYICGAVYLLGTIVFLIFAAGEEQPWAKEDRPRQDREIKYKRQIKYKAHGIYDIDINDSGSEAEL
ncbi:sialin-like [Lineus longissimus]|uniref:sialin-like n=1 Tax=Lineus longissimus TaxID=88925 RepID=UPI002B4EC14A